MKPYYETHLGRLFFGDCRKILPLLDKSDLLFTDIPFGVKHKYLEYKDSDIPKEYARQCDEWFSAFKGAASTYIVKVPTKNIHIVSPLFNQYLDYIWTIMQYSPNATTHGPFNLSLYTQYLIGGVLNKRPSCDVIRNTFNKLKTKHPAEMPVAPIKQLLLLFAESGQTIIDPFMGSGTTAEACEYLGFKWIGIEVTEKYCEIIAHRIERETKQLKLFAV